MPNFNKISSVNWWVEDIILHIFSVSTCWNYIYGENSWYSFPAIVFFTFEGYLLTKVSE